MKSTCRVFHFVVSSLLIASGLLASPAAAEPNRAAVVRVTTLETDLRPLAEQLTGAVAQAVTDEGYTTEITDVALDAIKTMLACESLTTCLRQLGTTLGAEVVVAGRLQREAAGGMRLTLLWVTPEKFYRDRFDVAADESPQLVADKMKAFARQEPFEPRPTGDGGDERVGDERVRDERVRDERVRDVLGPASGGSGLDVPRKSWILAGVGLASLTVGGVLLQTGLSRQNDIDAAPADTVEDLEALRDQEAAARRYNIAGSALLVAGGAAIIAGALFVVRNNRTPEGPVTRVTISAPQGALGSGLLFGVRGRL